MGDTHPNAQYLIEASGCHEWIHDQLTKNGHDVFVGHPIKREQNEDKSDGDDAERFCARHQVGDVNQVHVADPETRKIRDLVRTRAKLKGDKTRFTNRIESTLTRWGYHAEDNPDPFSETGRAQVTAEHPELAPLYNLADQLDHHIKALEKEVNREARGIPEVQRLQSIPGIGALTALGLHVEIQDIDRFPNAEALVSYFGLDPVIEQSGNDRWHAHRISKQGRSYIRGLLTQAAWVHTIHAEDSSLTATYHGSGNARASRLRSSPWLAGWSRPRSTCSTKIVTSSSSPQLASNPVQVHSVRRAGLPGPFLAGHAVVLLRGKEWNWRSCPHAGTDVSTCGPGCPGAADKRLSVGFRLGRGTGPRGGWVADAIS